MTTRRQVIAVVEHNAALREALHELLSACGYRTELFAAGGDFLSAAATSQASCLIVEMRLDDCLGVDLARTIAASGLNLPVIFINDETFRKQPVEQILHANRKEPTPVDRLIASIEVAIDSVTLTESGPEQDANRAAGSGRLRVH